MPATYREDETVTCGECGREVETLASAYQCRQCRMDEIAFDAAHDGLDCDEIVGQHIEEEVMETIWSTVPRVSDR